MDSKLQEGPIIISKKNNLVHVLLNREKALNSLNQEMLNILNQQLPEWCDPKNKIKYAIFQGKGRAYCAGGDIKESYAHSVQYKGNIQQLMEASDVRNADEYECYHNVSKMKSVKQIAILDGILMGGGCGISLFGKYKVATEKTMFAMPEAKIGFFCDVASSVFLSRLRNNLGYYLGITGKRLNGRELVSVGLADYYVESSKIEEMIQEIENYLQSKEFTDETDTGIESILQKYNSYEELKELDFEKDVKRIFGNVTQFSQLYDNLKNDNSEFSQQTLKELEDLCPLSIRVIFELIKRGSTYDLTKGIEVDYRLAHWFVMEGEFAEGTRCTLVDRNDTPNYKHKKYTDIPEDLVQSFFEKGFKGEEDFQKRLKTY